MTPLIYVLLEVFNQFIQRTSLSGFACILDILDSSGEYCLHGFKWSLKAFQHHRKAPLKVVVKVVNQIKINSFSRLIPPDGGANIRGEVSIGLAEGDVRGEAEVTTVKVEA